MQNPINWTVTNQEIGEQLYSGFSKFLIDISHKQLAKFGNKNAPAHPNILEIGAGRGEHFPFVAGDFSRYEMSDISAWGQESIKKLIVRNPKINFSIQDIQKINFPDESFDRVIVSCVLAHVDEPYQAMEELLRVLKVNGCCSIYISGDPGMLLRIIRILITKPKMKALTVPYSLINAISHRNGAPNILEMAKFIFRNQQMDVKYYPFKLKSWNFSTHIILNIKKVSQS